MRNKPYDDRFGSIQRKWKYTDEEIEKFRFTGCYDCHLDYGGDAWADVCVDNDVWELINPSEQKGGGLLCFNCMLRRLNFLGLKDVKIEFFSSPFYLEDK